MLTSLVLYIWLGKLEKSSWQIGYFGFLTSFFYQIRFLIDGLMGVTGFSLSPFRKNSTLNPVPNT